ncbi:MAG: hypothetical protein JSW63_06125 [Ignavibacterium sp.]|nr:MAG: hypothetical protein JSW63_06125 [Ignavibacterium sp.]
MLSRIFTILLILLVASCKNVNNEVPQSDEFRINTAHLDALYEEIILSDDTVGIIHIYSEYPDYEWVGDDDEGIACVDDVARAAIFYLKHYKSNDNTESLRKAKNLIEFLLYMQSENGFFYNFIFEDYSINKTHKNSINESNWWSWRALWALTESMQYFEDFDTNFESKILNSITATINAYKNQRSFSNTFTTIDGIKLPNWLPQGYASDRAALIILGLTNYHNHTSDSTVIPYLNKLCDGILMMQKGDSLQSPFYAFLSWQNIWHAYGNSQSYALLKTSSVLKRNDIKQAALNEINYFYDYLIKESYLNNFKLTKENNSYTYLTKQKLPQIAYDIRPMVFACLEAFNLTKDTLHAVKASELAGWFIGSNIAKKQMYNPSNGITFDGIISEDEVNLNSGAESTIEALLSLLAIEQNTISKNSLTKYFVQNSN